LKTVCPVYLIYGVKLVVAGQKPISAKLDPS
jgi:hypothetical protein